jgi:FixJ family two-component response regulator
MRQRLVAVVEDDPGMLRSIERLLKAHEFQPAAFTSAEEFLGTAAESEATCLILDIHLGGMSGIELRRQLTARGSSLPVIFMSAVDDERVRQTAIAVGCVAYFRKPFLPDHLIGAVNKAAGIA